MLKPRLLRGYLHVELIFGGLFVLNVSKYSQDSSKDNTAAGDVSYVQHHVIMWFFLSLPTLVYQD